MTMRKGDKVRRKTEGKGKTRKNTVVKKKTEGKRWENVYMKVTSKEVKKERRNYCTTKGYSVLNHELLKV